MDPAKLRLDEIFCDALELGTPAERAAYLERACGGDAELRRRVERLLQAHFQAEGFLAERPAVAAPTQEGVTESVGTYIGSYKLLDQIGEGGFGIVFMAEQMEPIRRKVALKVLKPGMDTRQVVARFEAERQALAIMDHPNIAKVFDGGATASGRPYFVMELVKGIPITEYCDQNHLTPRQRLELFTPVCHAVQHAHQKGIIHRDLKPSNILVTMQDTAPVAKVIDFGVAKALGQELTDKTLFTGLAQLIGTPLYMSPEQAGLGALDIDTRSDIYSLGVVLYELLTGSTPFAKERFKRAAYDEIRRIIREEDPPRPSTRLGESREGLPSISAQRHMEPAKLTKLLRGELDWIVMKCLEKDRNRRYGTANALASDVRRYLSDEQVQACPQSRWYRFRKFARKHRTALLTSALVSAALVVAVVTLAVSNVRVRHERDQKEQALRDKARALAVAEANFRKARAAVDRSLTLVSESDLFEAAGLEPLRKQLLESALQYYKEFVDQEPEDPELQAELAAVYFRIWQIYRSVDRYRDAIAALGKALDIAEKLRHDHPENSVVLGKLAQVRYGQLRFGGGLHAQFEAGSLSDIAESIRTLERAAALWLNLAAENPDIPGFQRNLGEVYDEIANLEIATDEPARALCTARKAYAVWEKLGREHPAMVAGGREKEYAGAMLALYLHFGGYPEQAQKLLQAGIDFAQKLANQCPRERLHRSSLAFLYGRLGDSLSHRASQSKETEQAWLRAISLYEDLVADHPGITSYSWRLGDCCRQLGQLLQSTGRHQEAKLYYARALKAFEKLATLYPDSTFYMANACGERVHLAGICVEAHCYDEAKEHFRRALELADGFVARTPNQASEVVSAYGEFADFLATCPDAKCRNPEHALALATRATEFSPKQSMAWITRGRTQLALERWDDAVADFSKAIEVAPSGDGAVPWAYCDRANAYRRLKQVDKALADLDKATELWPKLFDVWAWRGWFYRDREQWDKAAADFTRAVELKPTFWPVWFDRAIVDIHLKMPDKAVADLREAVRQGLPDAEERLKNDTGLEALHSREDFKKLLADVRTKSN